MTTEEFSNEFDVLLNSNFSNSQFGKVDAQASIQLDEYEKSVFLTQAQEELVLSLYNGVNGCSFEETEAMTAYLAHLVKQAELTTEEENAYHVISGSHVYKLPDDLLFVTYESVTLNDESLLCGGSKKRDVIVIPVTQDEFWRTNRNPFKRPNDRKVLRLAFGKYSTIDDRPRYTEIISKYSIDEYKVRYVRRPNPIILTDLSPSGLSINGVSSIAECELEPIIHKQILQNAVQKALSAKSLIIKQ